MNTLNTLAMAALATFSALSAARLKVVGSSVLVHMFGSHHLGPADRRRGQVMGELAGVLTLSVPNADYKADHERHHSMDGFARQGLDPDADLLWGLGLRPGTPERVLWQRLAWALVSPGFHARMSWARLRGTFLRGPRWRRAVAWAGWGGLTLGTAATGWLAAWLIGFVLPLLVFGNMAALLELASEHRWMVGEATGKERHAQLSHGRHPGAMPPFGRGPLAWAGWVLRTLGAAAVRYAVWPGDMPHHDRHHEWAKAAVGPVRWGWVNAALAYSPALWADEARQRQAVSTLREAIGRWFRTLAAERAVSVQHGVNTG